MSDSTGIRPEIEVGQARQDFVTPPHASSELFAVITALAERVDALTKITESLHRAGHAASATSTPKKLEDVEPTLAGRRESLRALPGSRALGKRRLIIPIHPPKISHLSSMFSPPSAIADDFDVGLTFVATNREEREMFEKYISLTELRIPVPFEIISAVEACDRLGFSQLAETLSAGSGSTINVKKLLAIYIAVLDGATEIICLDSDVVFVSSVEEVFSKARSNYTKSVFFAANSPSDITRDVVSACADFYCPEDAMKLKSIMGTNLFSWFYDVPYYPLPDVEAFLSHIAFCHGGIERALCRLTWHTFDHVLFLNYLVLRGLFNIADVTGVVGQGLISDNLGMVDIVSIKNSYDGYLPVWAPLSSMLSDPHLSAEAGFSLAMHVDRVGS